MCTLWRPARGIRPPCLRVCAECRALERSGSVSEGVDRMGSNKNAQRRKKKRIRAYYLVYTSRHTVTQPGQTHPRAHTRTGTQRASHIHARRVRGGDTGTRTPDQG